MQIYINNYTNCGLMLYNSRWRQIQLKMASNSVSTLENQKSVFFLFTFQLLNCQYFTLDLNFDVSLFTLSQYLYDGLQNSEFRFLSKTKAFTSLIERL